MRWPWRKKRKKRKKKPATRPELVLHTTLSLPNEKVIMSETLVIAESCWLQSPCQDKMLEDGMRRIAKSYYRQIERRRAAGLTEN